MRVYKPLYFQMRPHGSNEANDNDQGEPDMQLQNKAAVHSPEQTLSAEFSDRKIRVNAITIGPINTPLYGKLGLSEQKVNDFAQILQQKLLLKRLKLFRLDLSDELKL